MPTQTQNSLLIALAHDASAEPAWLRDFRAENQKLFDETGIPTQRHEAFKYTSFRPLLEQAFQPAAAVEITEADLKPYLIGDDDLRLVFVNGHFSDTLSRMPRVPDALLIEPLSRIIHSTEPIATKLGAAVEPSPFGALNAATFREGLYVHAAKALTSDRPLHVLFVTTGGHAVTTRLLMSCCEGTDLRLIESHVGLGDAPRFVSHTSEFILARNARLRHVRLLRETDASWHVAQTAAKLDRDAAYTHQGVALGARVARHEISALLNGEGANATLQGLTMAAGTQHVDHHITVDHLRPHCTSNQLFRSVADDRSHATFTGKVIVRPGAIGTDAKQQNNNLLLSDDAKVDTRPQLEIYADDVKCSHGATSGQLDANALFFLRSRGLDVKQARGVLTYAFANDLVEHIGIEPARQHLQQVMHEKFHGLLGE